MNAFLRPLDDAQVDNQENVGIASFIGAQVNVQGGKYFVLRRRRE